MIPIIWGTTKRTEPLGVVADWCDDCGRAQPFTLARDYKVGHIYYLPLGQGTLIATFRECWECGAKFHASEDEYDEILPQAEATQLTVDELVRQTSPRSRSWLQQLPEMSHPLAPGDHGSSHIKPAGAGLPARRPPRLV